MVKNELIGNKVTSSDFNYFQLILLFPRLARYLPLCILNNATDFHIGAKCFHAGTK